MRNVVYVVLLFTTVSQAATLEKKMLDLTKFPRAVCNDGSGAGYYVQKSLSNSTDWLIFQEGGGWVYDSTSCLYRPPGTWCSLIVHPTLEAH